MVNLFRFGNETLLSRNLFWREIRALASLSSLKNAVSCQTSKRGTLAICLLQEKYGRLTNVTFSNLSKFETQTVLA